MPPHIGFYPKNSIFSDSPTVRVYILIHSNECPILGRRTPIRRPCPREVVADSLMQTPTYDNDGRTRTEQLRSFVRRTSTKVHKLSTTILLSFFCKPNVPTTGRQSTHTHLYTHKHTLDINKTISL